MAKGDGVHRYYQSQSAERDRLLSTIAQFERDILSMREKLAGLDDELPQLETDLRQMGVEPVKSRSASAVVLPGKEEPRDP